MSYDPKDCEPEEPFRGMCPRHKFQPTPCLECADENEYRRRLEQKEQHRIREAKNKTRPMHIHQPSMRGGRR